MPYDTQAINAYDTLQQSTDESTKAYLHRAQDILEHIHHTNDMSSVTAIGTNHAKILTGLKDGKLHNKLAESKAKKWTNMGTGFCKMLLKWQSTLKGPEGTHYHLLKLTIHQLITITIPTIASKFPYKRNTTTQPKAWKVEMLALPGWPPKKDCPTVPNQSKSLIF